MYRTDLVKQVARQTGLSQHIVSDVLRASQQLVAQTLAAGDAVTNPRVWHLLHAGAGGGHHPAHPDREGSAYPGPPGGGLPGRRRLAASRPRPASPTPVVVRDRRTAA